ncbi:MAG: 2-dehydropantoate 2-reductase [Polyangiales bacterium]
MQASTHGSLDGSRPPRVLVVGCGGIGGITAAHLHQHLTPLGGAVVGFTTNEVIAAAVTEQGYRLAGADGARTVRGRCVTSLVGEPEPFDVVVLATQPPQVEDAARGALPWLAPEGVMLVLQNGLCEARIARIAGVERVVGAVVGWGAAMPEPGRYERTAAGGFTLGRIDGVDDPRLRAVASALECIGPVTITSNLAGARWSKLAINCTVSTLGTLGGERLGVLMRSLTVRRLALRIMTEVVRVAAAEGVRLEKVSGTLDLDWLALTDAEIAAAGSASLVAKHATLLAVGARFRRMRSSMLAAIERGRPPAVDFLNGEVVDRGARLGVPTPVNAAARELVHAIARGERRSSRETIRALAEATLSPA